jgi:hypothetical protein
VKHWDVEIARIEVHARHFALTKPSAIMGVAVDDETKRDYFVPRLQRILDDNAWARHLTFRVVPVNGADSIDVTTNVR